jgi:hypothetical protein
MLTVGAAYTQWTNLDLRFKDHDYQITTLKKIMADHLEEKQKCPSQAKKVQYQINPYNG